ncbi:acyloxyacyl hydrolase [Catalinimonas alkaloidigena]|uniref:acyloxyacyl hydrolase n=1 Tax=Catalinimonas alkaloidigena TaxID=1075417 RepID=UPI002406DAA2|nr:acyloxyacyl hydrolase [Catalinimonas alkaloidigena]
MGHLVKSHPQGFRASYLIHTNGNKYWQQLYAYPDIGISFSYQDYLNPTLGKSLCLMPFMQLYMHRGRVSNLLADFGIGVAYHTNPYHSKNNDRNVALGSHFSFSLNASLKYQLSISNVFSTGLLVHFEHYSNGGYKKPNSGANLLQGGFFINHKLKPYVKATHRQWEKVPLQEKEIYFTILPSFSLKELGIGSSIFPSYNLGVHINKPVSHISTLNFGVDAYHDIAIKKRISRKKPEEHIDHKSLAITGGHELMINKISFVTQVGYYIYRPYKDLYREFFQRYSLRIYVNPRLAVSGGLKVYLGKAEHVEWGLMFKL